MSFRINHPDHNPPKNESGGKRKRLLFILGSLEGGGAERVIINILRYLNRSKFELHLAVVHYFGNFIDSVPKDIVVHDLKALRVRKSFLPFIRLIRRLKPDILFSTMGYLNLAMIFLKPLLPRHTKLLVRESTIVSENLRFVSFPWIWRGLYRLFYNQADIIICLCQEMMRDLVEHFRVDPKKLIRIFNPVDMEEVRYAAEQGNNPFTSYGEGPHVVAIGRLGSEKGFDRLIRAFSFLLAKKPNARLWILGKGELENNLKELINSLGLIEKVFLIGFQKNPFPWLRHADLFVLSSRFEGLPNALLEALACGCSVVALRHPGGTQEVLEECGLLERFVPSLEAWPEVWWERPQPEVSFLLNHKFNIIRITGEYEDLLNNICLEKVY